jgi:MYXO-CTERM domain-containing protein
MRSFQRIEADGITLMDREAPVWWMFLAAAAMGGSLRATIDVGPNGPVLVDAVHVEGAVPLTSGDVEILDTEGQLLGTAAIPDPRWRTIIGQDEGGEGAKLEYARIRVDVPWPTGATSLRLGDQVLRPNMRSAPPPGDAVEVSKSGPPAQRLDLVFLGDGYRQSELDTFADDVDWIVDYLREIEPYGDYSGLFNIWRIDTASQDSGVSHDESGISRDTAYDCAYGCAGIDRLICCDDATVLAAVDAAVPDADGVLVLINDPVYGGSGGFNYATSYTGSDDGRQVAAHELGHSLVGLWDEYNYGYDGSGEGPNCAASSDGNWDEWFGRQDVSAFLECSYDTLYRPTQNDCMMKSLVNDYCPVCRQEAIFAMYAHLPGLVASITPEPGLLETSQGAVEFDVVTNGPDAGLAHEWTLDGEVVSTDADFTLRCSKGEGELLLRVYDDTPWVRDDPYDLMSESVGPWQVTVEGECTKSLDEIFEGCNCQSGPRPASAIWILALALLVHRRRG